MIDCHLGKGWFRVIDEELVGAMIDVPFPDDTYEEAKEKFEALIAWHVQLAKDMENWK